MSHNTSTTDQPEFIEVEGQIYLSEFIFQDELMKEHREFSILKYALWFIAIFSTITLVFLWPFILKGYSNQSVEKIENVR